MDDFPLSIQRHKRPLPPPPPRPKSLLFSRSDFWQTIRYSWMYANADRNDTRAYIASRIPPLRNRATAVVDGLIPQMLRTLKQGMRALTRDQLTAWYWHLWNAMYQLDTMYQANKDQVYPPHQHQAQQREGQFKNERRVRGFADTGAPSEIKELPTDPRTVTRMVGFAFMVAVGHEVIGALDPNDGPVGGAVPELLFAAVDVARERFGSADVLYSVDAVEYNDVPSRPSTSSSHTLRSLSPNLSATPPLPSPSTPQSEAEMPNNKEDVEGDCDMNPADPTAT